MLLKVTAIYILLASSLSSVGEGSNQTTSLEMRPMPFSVHLVKGGGSHTCGSKQSSSSKCKSSCRCYNGSNGSGWQCCVSKCCR